MRMQLIPAVVALAAASLSMAFPRTAPRLLGVQRAASSPAGPCAFTDKGNPKALNGSVHQNNYDFTHISDVDEGSPPSHYSAILRNDHLTKLLPAKWVKAGVLFDDIAVNGCGRNDFDSTLMFAVDVNAPVEYGPQTQHSAPAEAYVRQTPQSTRGPTAQKLTSRIFALLAGQRIDFNFTAYISDGVFHYEAQNKGSQDVPFRIPALTNAWSQFQAQRSAQWAPWPTNAPNVFSLDASGPIREFRITSQQAAAFTEDVVAVQILSKEAVNTVVAAGRVSLYLPASGPGR